MADQNIVTITCPLCGKRFDLNGALNHRRKHHKQISMAEFAKTIQTAKRHGDLLYSRETIKGSESTATTMMLDKSRMPSKGMIRIVTGGFGVKK